MLAAVDADKNKQISSEKIEGAPAALKDLDKNKDGKLVEDELRHEIIHAGFGGNRRGGERVVPP